MQKTGGSFRIGDRGLGRVWSMCFRESLLILKWLKYILYPGIVLMNFLILFLRCGFPGTKPCSSVVRHSERRLSLSWPEGS